MVKLLVVVVVAVVVLSPPPPLLMAVVLCAGALTYVMPTLYDNPQNTSSHNGTDSYQLMILYYIFQSN